MSENMEFMTTAEWLALPLRVEDVDGLCDFLEAQGMVNSSWPWPLINKVLEAARSVAQENV